MMTKLDALIAKREKAHRLVQDLTNEIVTERKRISVELQEKKAALQAGLKKIGNSHLGVDSPIKLICSVGKVLDFALDLGGILPAGELYKISLTKGASI